MADELTSFYPSLLDPRKGAERTLPAPLRPARISTAPTTTTMKAANPFCTS